MVSRCGAAAAPRGSARCRRTAGSPAGPGDFGGPAPLRAGGRGKVRCQSCLCLSSSRAAGAGTCSSLRGLFSDLQAWTPDGKVV